MNKISSVDDLFRLKKFRFLSAILLEIIEENQVEILSSELQVRYSSRDDEESERAFSELEEFFGLNLQVWKILSSKQRRLVYQLAILAGISDYRRNLIESLLKGTLGDQEIRGVLERELTQSYLINALKDLSSKDLRYLARMTGDLQKLLVSKGHSFRSLIKVQSYLKKKKRPRRLVRHKGYRDHGSLGQESHGFDSKFLQKLITDQDDQNFYEEEGYLPEDIPSFFDDPLLYQSIWIFS